MSSVPELTSKARKHWAKWLPKKAAELKASGQWEVATQDAATEAMAEMQKLMQMGFQEHEAEEVVLQKLILLPPEPKASVPAEERAELARLEAQHRSLARS